MRYALAVAVVAVGLSAAVYIHQRVAHLPMPASGVCLTGDACGQPFHPSWEDPVAILVGLGSVAVAVGIALRGRA
jgi:hypothetical protein